MTQHWVKQSETGFFYAELFRTFDAIISSVSEREIQVLQTFKTMPPGLGKVGMILLVTL